MIYFTTNQLPKLLGSSGSSSEPGSPIYLARGTIGEVSDVGTSNHMFHLTDLYQAPPGQARASAKLPKNTVQLSDEQMLLVSSLLYGYSLRDGMWGKSRAANTKHDMAHG